MYVAISISDYAHSARIPGLAWVCQFKVLYLYIMYINIIIHICMMLYVIALHYLRDQRVAASRGSHLATCFIDAVSATQNDCSTYAINAYICNNRMSCDVPIIQQLAILTSVAILAQVGFVRAHSCCSFCNTESMEPGTAGNRPKRAKVIAVTSTVRQ